MRRIDHFVQLNSSTGSPRMFSKENDQGDPISRHIYVFTFRWLKCENYCNSYWCFALLCSVQIRITHILLHIHVLKRIDWVHEVMFVIKLWNLHCFKVREEKVLLMEKKRRQKRWIYPRLTFNGYEGDQHSSKGERVSLKPDNLFNKYDIYWRHD